MSSLTQAPVQPVGPILAGRYYRLPNGTLTTSATLGNNTMRVCPKFIPPGTPPLMSLGLGVTIIGDVGSKFRPVIYGNVAGDFRPGGLLLDAGQSIAGDAVANQVPDLVTPFVWPYFGWFWIGALGQLFPATQPTVQTLNAIEEPNSADYLAGLPATASQASGFTQTGLAGAAPATFGVPAGIAGSVPSMMGRF